MNDAVVLYFCRRPYSVLVSMAFVGRVLLNHIRHVQKARVVSAALRWHRLPVVSVVPARMASEAATAMHEGKQNGRCQ